MNPDGRNRARLPALAVSLVVLAAPALAQNPTATLTGHVSDGKAALPGVTVIVSSPNLQGTRATVTAVDGDYILKYLPAGKYDVRFELEGFVTVDTAVRVNAAQTQELDTLGTKYYFTSRDAFRWNNLSQTDLSFSYAFVVPVLGADLQFFLEPRVTNVLNAHAVLSGNTSVFTSNSKPYLAAFNPFTTKPLECPQADTPAQCMAMGANWQKGPQFGQPVAPTDYQTPRTYVISLGVRF